LETYKPNHKPNQHIPQPKKLDAISPTQKKHTTKHPKQNQPTKTPTSTYQKILSPTKIKLTAPSTVVEISIITQKNLFRTINVKAHKTKGKRKSKAKLPRTNIPNLKPHTIHRKPHANTNKPSSDSNPKTSAIVGATSICL